MSRILLYALSLLVCSLSAFSAWGADTYHMLIFGAQSSPRRPQYTHTWATFVRVSGEGEDRMGSPLEGFTISWLPASLRIHTFYPFAQPGVNLNLQSTLQYVFDNNEHVSGWGPFIIDAAVYDRALRQKAKLEGGEVKYKAIDPEIGPRVETVANCIHAITDLDPSGRGRLYYWELQRFGESASHFVAHQIATRFGRTEAYWDRDWIQQRLGIGGYPIVWRPFPRHRLWAFDR